MANTHRHHGGPYGGPLDHTTNYQTVSSGPLYQEYCGPCGRLFQDKDEILWHRLLCGAHNPKLLCPTHKNIQFRDVDDLRLHIMNNNRCFEAFKANTDGRGFYNCKTCRILISNPIELDRHLKTPEHAQNLRRCDACGLKFQSAQEQLAHYSQPAVKHQRGAAQICKCGWVLVSTEELVKHIEIRHLSTAPPMRTTYKQAPTHPPPPNTRPRVPTPTPTEEDGEGYLSSASSTSSAASTGSIKDEITKLNTQLNSGTTEPNQHKCIQKPKSGAPQDSRAPSHHQAQLPPRALGSNSQQPSQQPFHGGRNTRAKLEQHRLRDEAMRRDEAIRQNAARSRMEEERKKEKKEKEQARKRQGSINLIIFD